MSAVNDRLAHLPIINNEIISVATGIASCKSFYHLQSAMKEADIILYRNKKKRNEQREPVTN